MLELYLSTLDSNTYKNGLRIDKTKKLFHSGEGFISSLTKHVNKKISMRKMRKVLASFERPSVEYKPDYFLNQRIAVYTCYFGNYDVLQEPLSMPNNIDYYVITDQQIPQQTAWKRLDVSQYEQQISGFTNVEKNRWFKMHPHVFLSDYRYSVYVDANVVPVTDFTELVNRIGNAGVAMFWHRYDNCVYQEALYNNIVLKKTNPKEIDKQVDYLHKMGMPENYGMTTCNVIARDHENNTCIKLMEDWWSEFMGHCRRDQLSFPYVAWKNGVSMEEVARLGNDVWSSHALYVVEHVG